MSVLFKHHTVKGKNKVLLSFEGELAFEDIDGFVRDVEKKIVTDTISLKTQRKIFNVLVEILQNIYNNVDFSKATFKVGEKYYKSTVKVWTSKDRCYVATGNYILTDNVPKLETWLKEICTYSREEIRVNYRRILNDPTRTEKGAELGFLDVARRTGHKFDFSFSKADNKFSYFNFETFIPLDLNE